MRIFKLPAAIVALFSFIAILSLSGNQAAAQSPQKPCVLMGYVGRQDWTQQTIDVEKLTHINYAFAIPAQNGELAPLKSRDPANFAALRALKSRNKDLKILISIGGWGGCRYFSDASLTDESRAKFADSAVALVKQHELDGIDIDWEYPAQIGANNIFRPEDKHNYTLLLKTLREHLDARAAADKRADKYLLTIATGVDAEFLRLTELGIAQQYLDYVNVMTYDIYHGNDHATGHHSNLFKSAKGDHSRNSSDDAVKAHIAAGVPASKIVLGIPFYGRGWTDVTDQDDGLYQPAAGKRISVSYDDLVDSYINTNGYVRHWDDQAKVPYLWNPTNHTFITYADPEALAAKTDYVKKQGLAGVMFWEYSEDTRHKQLLNALYHGLH